MAFPRFSLHSVAVSLLGSSMVLAVWLVFGLRFDLQSSPAWHFVPYLLMLASTIIACSVMWTFPAFSWLGRLQFLLPLLVFLLLGVFLVWDWIHSGPYTSIRDERYFPTVVRASAVSVMGFAVLGVFQAVFMSTLCVGHRMGWCWVSRIPGSHSFLPFNPSPDTNDLVEGEADQDQPDQEEYRSYGEPHESTSPVPHGGGSEQDNGPRHSHKGTEDQFRIGE